MSIVEADRASEPASDHASARRRSRVSTASLDSIGDSPRVSVQSNVPLPVKPPSISDRLDRDVSVRADPPQTAPGHSAEQYYYGLDSPASTRSSSLRGPIDRRKPSSNGYSSRSGRDHVRSRDLIRLLLTEHRDSKDALTMLNKTAERMEVETQRANEAERKLQEANDRWRSINQARLQAQAEANRLNEELRLYKLQLEAAQSQIARANDMITQTDREKSLAEDEAAKAKRLAKKYEMETLIQKAREEGRRLGREQGIREGREQGYHSAFDEAYFQARDETHDRYVKDQNGYDDYEDEHYPEEDGYEDEMTIPPTSATVETTMPIPQRQRGAPAMRQQEMPPSQPQFRPNNQRMRMPEAMPSPSPSSSRPRRSNGLVSRIMKGRRSRSEDPAPQLEVNANAPDVGMIMQNEPGITMTSPVPELADPDPVYMPEPNYNPDPATVGPISMMGAPRSPSHPRVDIPPDGYIPPMREDGTIGIPPAHDFQPAMMTPRTNNSPLPGPSTLPPAEYSEPVVPMMRNERDFGYGDEQAQPRRRSKHRYQKSVADSVASTTTSNLSILSPPNQRISMAQPRLSAIPEASPSGSMSQGNMSFAPPRPSSRNSMVGGMDDPYAAGMPPGDFGMPGSARSRPMDMGGAFSPRSAMSGFSGPRRPPVITTPAPLAPGGYEQAYTRPRRTSDASSFMDAGSTRGRTRAIGSEYGRGNRPATAMDAMQGETPEITIEPPSRSESQQSRKSYATGAAMSPRMRSSDRAMNFGSMSGLPGVFVPSSTAPAPEPLPDGFMNMTPRASQTPLMPLPEGVPAGFVPSPVIPDGVPPGFIPTSPAVPAGFVSTTPGPMHAWTPSLPAEPVPRGFVPTSPAVPSAHGRTPSLPAEPVPPGFVPTSPAVPAGYSLDAPPPGFIPTSPGVPTSLALDAPPRGFIPGSPAPPGFVPTVTRAPSAPDGLTPGLPLGFQHMSPALDAPPPGFMLHSPSAPPPQLSDPPPGFMPTSTSMPAYPLPGGSPAMSMSGALPILPRTISGGGWDDPPRAGGANEVYNSGAGSRMPTAPAMSRRQSSSGPVIPDSSILEGSRMRRASRVSFGVDPAGVALPSTTAPSFVRSTSSSRPAYSRVTSSRSDASGGGRVRANPYGSGTPGLPPVGLASPYSRRLEPHPEDLYDNERVPSDGSGDTLTTPPQHRRGAQLPGAVPVFPMPAPVPPSPAVSVRSTLSRAARAPLPASSVGLSRAASRASMFLPPDPVDAAAATAYARSKGSGMGTGSGRDAGGFVDPSLSPGGLRRSPSRASLNSRKSYERFDRDSYVDPAVLASGRMDAAVPLPTVESSNSGPKAKKGKKAKRR